MPIIEMKKVYLLAHRQEREKVFNLLHEFGRVELLDVTAGSSWGEYEALLQPEEPAETLSDFETDLSSVRYCIDSFQRYFPIRKNFVQQFTGAKLTLSPEQFSDYTQRVDEVKGIYDTCRSAEERLARLRNEETQCRNQIEELKPWLTLDLPLAELGKGGLVGTGLYITTSDNLEVLRTGLEQALPDHFMEEISSDNEFSYFVFTALNEERTIYEPLLKENSVSTVSFPDLRDTAAKCISFLEEELARISKEKKAVIENVESIVDRRPMLMACFDYISNELEKQSALSNLAGTESSFLLEGWVPQPLLSDLEKALSEEISTAHLVSRNPEPGENVPVLLHNRGPVEAYEVVTKLYSTPKIKELDPTPFMAPFFFVFFGICLSDVGYGVVLALMALFVSRKLKLEGMGKQLINLLFLGGISSLFFGILLGSYFGDLIKLPALWFDPLEDPMRMLFYCFGIGLIHIYFGMALQAYRNIKAGQALSAIFDQGFWFIFLNGLILLFLPETAEAGRWLAIGGAAGLILTQGRSQQGIAKKFMSGLLSLYNITGYLSDVLSYSRLLALGLATGVIAAAINSMGGMISGGVIGTVIMAVVLLGGHLFNIIISTLGSYVHTSRLQYIEFFSKFFEGGGKAFQPFRTRAAYVDIAERE